MIEWLMYIEIYLVLGVLYSFALYDLMQENFKRKIHKHPMAKDLPQENIDSIIKYGPLVGIIMWPFSLLGLIINIIRGKVL